MPFTHCARNNNNSSKKTNYEKKLEDARERSIR